MLFTKERNSNNQNLGLETSNLSLKVPDIFDNSNNYFSSSASSYTSSLINTSGIKNQTYKDLATSSKNNKNTTQRMSLVKSSAVVAAVQPDLIIQNAVNPSVGSVGESIEVSYQVKNQGTGSAGYQQTKFYLSTNTTLSNDDIYLGSDYLSPIAAGASSGSTTTININNSIAVGNYYLLYQADGNNNIAESNENNNIVAKAIAIKKADLIIQNAVNSSVGSVGESIEVSYQVKNQGTGSAGYQQTKFYLSTNTTLSNDDIYLGSDYLSPIAAGASSGSTTTININNSIAVGNYYLLYQADGNN
ncbi:CARDB domain-containing protein, partial [Nostoc linckia]